jgi:predicted glutamine amidotransferase
MCQLLGMNCASPTDFSFSLRGFCKRGGMTDVHSHGWGLSVYGTDGAIGLRSFHDTLPASQSPIAEFIQKYPMRTHVSERFILLFCVVLFVFYGVICRRLQ